MSTTSETDSILSQIDLLAQNALSEFGLPSNAKLQLINYSENITYRVDNISNGDRFALRVHRPEYHTLANIKSELDWMKALANDAKIPAAIPVASPDGDLVKSVGVPGLSNNRFCVLFEWLDGEFPSEEKLVKSFGSLGEITARLHNHAMRWNPPQDFKRQTWDMDLMFGENAIWGPWQQGMGLTANDIELLDKLLSVLKKRLEHFGTTPDRFGLIHADLRLANILIEKNETKVIDFDDCGFGWYLYDFGTAVSFIEDRPDMNELIASWVNGYRKVMPLPEEQEKEIPTFVMIRRLLLTAWIASHSDTELAQSQGMDYSNGTCILAEDFLTKQN